MRETDDLPDGADIPTDDAAIVVKPKSTYASRVIEKVDSGKKHNLVPLYVARQRGKLGVEEEEQKIKQARSA